MPELHDVFQKYLQFDPGPDNLPIIVKSRLGRNRGRQMLAMVMHDLGFQVGVEIGTRDGKSAMIWCEAMPGLDLTCIDPYRAYYCSPQASQDKHYARAQVNAQKFGFKLLKMTSMDAVDQFEDGALDFVNIDGDHAFDACAMDLIRYVPKVRKGGLILLHDYCTFRLCGVIRAVDAYTHCHRIDPWYVTRDYNPTAFWQRGAERA